MTAKEYLLQIQHLHIQIEIKKERLERIRVLLTSPAVGEIKQDKVQTSISIDKQERLIVDKADLEDELQRLMYEEAVLIIRIGKQIDGMEDPLHAKILHLRYEEFQSLWVVAQKTNYSYSHIRRLHGQALKEFAECYLKDDT